jgi:ElaB/YqjD/DUF883 family membrane-anchored ribosome-binding protein
MHHGNGGEPNEEAQRKIRQLVDEATEKGRALLNEGLETAREAFEERTAELKKKAAEYGLDEAADNVRTYVKKNPWTAIGIAAFVGLVVGRLFSDRD